MLLTSSLLAMVQAPLTELLRVTHSSCLAPVTGVSSVLSCLPAIVSSRSCRWSRSRKCGQLVRVLAGTQAARGRLE